MSLSKQRGAKRGTLFCFHKKSNGRSSRTKANYLKHTNSWALQTLESKTCIYSQETNHQDRAEEHRSLSVSITSLCMVLTCVGLMDRASSYQRLASSMFPLSSAICPLMYSTLWDVGKRLAASCVQAEASAGFDMPVYTSAVRNTDMEDKGWTCLCLTTRAAFISLWNIQLFPTSVSLLNQLAARYNDCKQMRLQPL